VYLSKNLHMQKLLLLLVLLQSIFSVSAQNLSNTEKKIVTYINTHLPEAEKLLIETVNINSGTLNITGVKKVGEIFGRELEKAGFTTDMTRSAMSDIIGAGGSTRSARGNATFTNQLARNFDLTNASSAMGRISSLTGNAEESQNSMIRVMSEAVALGLDDSQFAEEQRKFVDNATQVIQRSGATTADSQGNVAGGFSKFVAGQDMASVQGARKAYEITNALSGESGGARGVIQAAGLSKDKNLSQLDRNQRNQLLQMTDEQLDAGGIAVEGMAASAGLTTEEFVKKARLIHGNLYEYSKFFYTINLYSWKKQFHFIF
jgi:ribosomal protein L18